MIGSVERQAGELIAVCLAYRTRRLARAVTRIYNDCLRPHGLNITEMNLMAAIAAQGSVQPARLGRAMELEKSTLSRNSGRLVKQGWLEVRDHPDGPGVVLALTAHGYEMLRQALPAWNEAQRRAASLVTGALPGLGAVEEGT